MTTLQSLYEKMRAHLLAMPAPAWEEDVGGCYYRTSDGNACLVGCLLTDEVARKADERTEEASILARRYFSDVHNADAFFEAAQAIHDKDAGANSASSHAGNMEVWRTATLQAFDALAGEYGLEVPA
jgi:hypothetical protein